MSGRELTWVLDRAPGVLTTTQFTVAMHLARHANKDDGLAFPSHETLAELSNVSERTVRRTLRQLEELGFITEVRPHSQHYPAVYTFPAEFRAATSGRSEAHDEEPRAANIDTRAATGGRSESPRAAKRDSPGRPPVAPERPRATPERPPVAAERLRNEVRNDEELTTTPAPAGTGPGAHEDPAEIHPAPEPHEPPPPVPAGDPVTVQFLTEFWPGYPRSRGSKAKSLTAWRRLSAADRRAVLVALPEFVACDQWQREGHRFVPYAEKWLRDRGWEDDVPTVRVAERRAGRDPNEGLLQPSREPTPIRPTLSAEERAAQDALDAAAQAARLAERLAAAEMDPVRLKVATISPTRWAEMPDYERERWAKFAEAR